MTTKSTKKSEIKRSWHLLDAQGQILGRLSTKIAGLLIGKNKPQIVNYLDSGDYVVIINVEKIQVSGRKAKQKKYYSHSGYPKGFKEIIYEKQQLKNPQYILEHAVAGMLPKNKLRDPRLARLKIFVGEKHTYEDKFKAQN